MEVIYFNTIDSTQKYAIQQVLQRNIFTNTAIITKSQTNGVGRTGAKWFDGNGNVMMTIILPYHTAELQSKLNSSKIGSIMHSILSEYLPNITIKEPNDLLIDGKKICGTIINHEVVDNVFYVIIGIGINVKSHPELENYPTTSLLNEGVKASCNEVVDKIINTFNDTQLI